MNHKHFMHSCLQIAQKGRGLVGENPMVGSVLVRKENIIAQGVYLGCGKPHAERQLLEKYDQKISSEDVLYVNLEPCCHHGNTPPCTEAIIKSGIQTVVIGMKDPDSRVAGKGVQALRDAGIHVIGPVMPELCRRLNKGFVSLRENGRPYITLKRAQTREGAIAKPDGSKLCITSDEQNLWSHIHLRATHDAILVGVQTVITDDPELTVRNGKWKVESGKSTKGDVFQPRIIVFDPNVRIPLDAKVIGDRCIVIIDTKNNKNEKVEDLQKKGVHIIPVTLKNDHFDLHDLWQKLSTFPVRTGTGGHFPLSTVLVEGGEQTWNAFKETQMIDEEVVLIG